MSRETTREQAAVCTLERMGYTYHDGELWKPPLGATPNFDAPNRPKVITLNKDGSTTEAVFDSVDEMYQSLLNQMG